LNKRGAVRRTDSGAVRHTRGCDVTEGYRRVAAATGLPLRPRPRGASPLQDRVGVLAVRRVPALAAWEDAGMSDAGQVLYECPSCGMRISAILGKNPVGVDAAIEAHRGTHEQEWQQ
jgi:hypothetical protein